MDQNKNKKPSKHTMDLDLDLPKDTQPGTVPVEDRLRFDPDFSGTHANPFLETPLMEISDDPEPGSGPRKHSPASIFWTVCFYLILLVAVVLGVKNTQDKVSALDQQLEEYELAQAPHFVDSLFQQYFASPDWGALFDMAAPEIQSQYEGKDAYIRYAEAKVSDQPLSYRYLRSISDTEDEYTVYAGKEAMASFTVQNSSTDPAAPHWQLGTLKLLYSSEGSYRITHTIGHTVKVNGVALTESTLIKSTQMAPTKVLKVLPIQVPVIGTNTHEVQGLMAVPVVTIEDSNGHPLQVNYDQETHEFSEAINQETIPQEIRTLALDTVHAYCEYMIQGAFSGTLSQYFKAGTDTMNGISSTNTNHLQRPQAYAFSQEEVSNLVYYTEDLFSVDVKLQMDLTREDNTVKQDRIEKSLFFEKDFNGNWLCVNMTGEKLFDEVTTVRVRFVQDDKVLSSRMIDQKEQFIYCPDAEIPTELPDNTPGHNMKKNDTSYLEKISFAGWGLLLEDKYGKPYYQPVFKADLDRKAEIPGGLLEEPVTLYPIFVWETIK